MQRLTSAAKGRGRQEEAAGAACCPRKQAHRLRLSRARPPRVLALQDPLNPSRPAQKLPQQLCDIATFPQFTQYIGLKLTQLWKY